MRKYTARILLPQRVMIPIVGAGFAVVVAVGVYHAVFEESASPEHRLAEERASSLLNGARGVWAARGRTSCPSIADLAGARQSTVDPWGRSFVIECDRDTIRAISLGPDGERGTEDDVVVEQRDAS